MAVLGLHDVKRSRMTGSIRVGGKEIIGATDQTMRRIRGNDVAMIFQDPLTALHPFYTIGAQIIEAYRLHNKVDKKVAKKRAVEMLDRVGIPQPDRRVDDYPHQFSGGMRQRAMIAMSLVNNPKLLIADEPTTALDVTVQAQILDLIQDLQKEFGSAVVMITHDLGVIAEIADEVLVMYAGRCVEKGTLQADPDPPRDALHLGPAGQHRRRDRRRPDKPLIPIPGTPPSLLNPPTGCAFHPRCPHTGQGRRQRLQDRAARAAPGHATPGHLTRCHLNDPDSIYENEVKEEVLG